MSYIFDIGRKLPKVLRKQKVFTIYRHLDHPLRGLSKPPSAAGVYRKTIVKQNDVRDRQRKHQHGMVSKRQCSAWNLTVPTRPLFWCGSRYIDVWFARKIPNLSMHYLMHTNQNIKIEYLIVHTNDKFNF